MFLIFIKDILFKFRNALKKVKVKEEKPLKVTFLKFVFLFIDKALIFSVELVN